jgi:hypothetical protein
MAADNNRLEIHNDGPEIVRTNYWRSDASLTGALLLSVNHGTLRLLVPPNAEHLFVLLPEEGTRIELWCDDVKGKPTLRLVWPDDAFSLEIDQCDQPWSRSEDGRLAQLIWYTQVGTCGVAERRRERAEIFDELLPLPFMASLGPLDAP